MTGPVPPETWRRIAALLDQLLDLPEERRREHLDRICFSDPELKRQVLAFLAAGEGAGRFLEGSPFDQDGSAEAEDPQGGTIGAYRLLRRIGYGGMGVVYLASRADGQFEKEVALKLVRHGLDNLDIVARFRRERQILARLEHPHIARLLDGGMSDDGRPYLVMEYVQGDPITRWCDDRAAGIEERLRLFRDVCETVQYAHRNLVVHRDLKPSNILVSGDGQVKLLDFGIAKLLAEEGSVEAPTLTRSGFRPMTPEYAAPEQALDAPLTTAADVYSLGVVLYELLAGRRPSRSRGGETGAPEPSTEAGPIPPSRIVARAEPGPGPGGGATATPPEEIARRRSTTPDRLRRRLRGDLDTVVLKALQRDPARRYRTVEALVEDLDRHREGLPIRARRDTWGYRAGKFLARHRWGTAAAALLALSLGIGVAGTLWQSHRARQEAAKAREVKDFTLSLFKVSDPHRSQGTQVSARDLLDEGARRVEVELRDQPEVQAEMMQLLGRVYGSLAVFDRGLPLLQRALELERAAHGPESLEVASALRDLGVLLNEKGDYDEAERTLRAALELQERLAGKEDPGLGPILAELGTLLTDKGNLEEAEVVDRRALAVNRRAYGEDHLEVAMSLSDLGALLFSRARYREAGELFEQALRIRDAHPGSDRFDTATVMHNYAGCLSALGELDRAEALLRRVLQDRRASLGPNHTYLAVSLDVLGNLLREKGEFAEATATLQEALDIRRGAQGPDSPEVAKTLHNLGFLEWRRGDVAAARRYFDQAVAAWRKSSPEDNPNLLAARNGVGMVLIQAGDHEAAERTLRDVLARRLARFGEENMQVAQSEYILGSLLGRLERFDEGETMLRHALATRRSFLGPDHFSVAAVQEGLAGLLRDRGRADESLPLYQQALAIDRKTFTRAGPQTGDALVGYGRALLVLHRPAEAEPLLREGLEICRRVYVAGDPRTAEASIALGCCLFERGATGEALPLLAEGLPALEHRPLAPAPLVDAGRAAFARLTTTRH